MDEYEGPTPHPWQLVGGHPALDLANTRSWRLDLERDHDLLVDHDRLLDWVAAATEIPLPAGGTLPRGSDPAAAVQVLQRVRVLRDALIRLLDASLAGVVLPPADVAVIEDAWRQSLLHAHLHGSLPLRWEAAAGQPVDLVDRLAMLVGGFLAGIDVTQLRRCDGAGCGWFFLDTTRNHSRRWCDPGDCGNRARVQRYRDQRSG